MLLILKVLLKSFIVGSLGACAMGPIFLLILNRALDKGFLGGLVTALGISTADAIFFSFGLAGSLSVAARSIFIVRCFEGFGGLILIFFGINTLLNLKKHFYESRGNEILPVQKTRNTNFVWMGLSAFFINISNPMTFLFFATIATKVFPELIIKNFEPIYILYAALACFCGSLFSFSMVSAFASLIARFFTKKVRIVLEAVSATMFLGFGIYLFASFVKFMLKSAAII